MERRVFYLSVLGVSVLAVVFQGIGFFTPAWMSMHLEVEPGPDLNQGMSVDINIGLWELEACAMGTCRSVDIDHIERYMSQPMANRPSQVAWSQFLGDLTKQRVLACIGAASTAIAFILLLVNARDDADGNRKLKALSCAAMWALSAIFFFAAVGQQNTKNTYFEHGSDMLNAMETNLIVQTNFAWSLLLTGLGALASFIVCFAVLGKLYLTEVGGNLQWIKFSNPV